MKVVRIISRLNVGGPAQHAVWLSAGLLPPEFESTLIAGVIPEGESDMSYFAAENGIEPVHISELSRELSYRDAVSIYKLYRHLLRLKPDIIHTHTAKAGTVGRAAAFLYKWLRPSTLIGRPKRVKKVHTFHGHVFHSYYGGLKTRTFLTIERFLARMTDRIIVISPQQLEEINGKFRIGRREQFRVIPLGLDLERSVRKSGIREEFAIPDDTFLVAFTGRLTEIKNLDLLLDAAKLVEGSTSPKIHIILIGDGGERQRLEERVRAEGIRNVTFAGHRRSTNDLIGEFDAFVLTSRNEGTPLSMIEAMAAGVAVASTVVGGVKDLLGKAVEQKNGFAIYERGLGITSFDAGDLKECLLYLSKNEKLRSSLAANAARSVKDNYSKERLVADIANLYREISA